MSLKALAPWWIKIGAKVMLSRLPARYRLWQRLNLFVHGDMQHPEYAARVVREHMERAGWCNFDNRTVLELGPGDSLASAVIAAALGARQAILVDSGAYATHDMKKYRALVAHLAEAGLRPPDISSCETTADLLAVCNARYLTDGLVSLRSLPSSTVDFVFSHAVLEHVRKRDVLDTLRETVRCMRTSAIASHSIDLRDHLGGALNNLRFSEELWETEWMAASGFYTNRLRCAQLCDLCRAAGFEVTVVSKQRFGRIPTSRRKLHAPFDALPDDELLISAFDVVLKPEPLPARRSKGDA